MGDDTPVRQVGDQEDPIALASVPFSSSESSYTIY